jgi:hypothetical protein
MLCEYGDLGTDPVVTISHRSPLTVRASDAPQCDAHDHDELHTQKVKGTWFDGERLLAVVAHSTGDPLVPSGAARTINGRVLLPLSTHFRDRIPPGPSEITFSEQVV